LLVKVTKYEVTGLKNRCL